MAASSSGRAVIANCPRCGRPLLAGTLDGLCPACLMRQALASEPAAASVSEVAGENEVGGETPGPSASVLFTPVLTSSSWILVTLMADDEEYVTYLAREASARGADGTRDAGAAGEARLGQLLVRKQHVPASERAHARRQLPRRLDALRSVSHPALAPVLDAGLTDDGHPFLVTAFVMATPLGDLEAEGASPDTMRRLLDDARAALQTLHEAGLAHGRIRASTVLARRAKAGATAVVTGFAPLDHLPTLSDAIAEDLQQLQRVMGTLRI